ncbi:hypothetical protein GOP47_0019289 [Adiantum capillus-veneris]|uniref:Uncharacterized protein n=1 Tax=Adiantum capillus-veneris TaxID=13818 RepID=A0A9D4UEY9_ADICA|nr:hypothetical protein GOP47_0019289 [Adiantum capillus-veneris]
MGLSSARTSKGKAPAELLSLLEHHLPKRARSLLSPLSDDDREVLTYMLAFGLHLQMLAGVIFPAQKLQQKSSSSAKVGLKHELNFTSHSFQFLSSKRTRSRPGKPPSLVAHKTSCSCDCFSCYSSFWSRWAASSNRDLLSTIIEMAEMGEEEDDRKPQRGKENTKKQAKKHVLGKGKKCKGKYGKLQGTQDTSKHSLSSRSKSEMDDCTTATPEGDFLSVSTSVDASYDALRSYECMDEAQIANLSLGDGAMLTKTKDPFYTASDANDMLARGVALMGKTSRNAFSSCGDTHAVARFEQDKMSTVMENEVVGSCPALAMPGDILQSKSISRLHCAAKRRSNQIMPLDVEGTFIAKDDVEELGQLCDNSEGCLSPRVVVGANARDKGVFSQVFPSTLCDIASRLWDLVSLGPRSHAIEYH